MDTTQNSKWRWWKQNYKQYIKVLFALYSFSFDLCRNVESNEYLLTWFMGFGMGIYFKLAIIFIETAIWFYGPEPTVLLPIMIFFQQHQHSIINIEWGDFASFICPFFKFVDFILWEILILNFFIANHYLIPN
jgi:hypothetical protein